MLTSYAPTLHHLIDELITDVITNKKNKDGKALGNKFINKQPKFSLFGDVHQPKATEWRIGETICLNVGYFRASSNYLELSSLDI